jgi:hypothetical protein
MMMVMAMPMMPDRHGRTGDVEIAAHYSELSCAGSCCVTVDQNGAVRRIHVSNYPVGVVIQDRLLPSLNSVKFVALSLVVPYVAATKTVTMSLKDIDDIEKSAGSDFASPAATICAAGLGAVELTELQKTRGMCSP